MLFVYIVGTKLSQMIQQPTRLFDFIYHQEKQHPKEKCYNFKQNGTWHSISTKEFIDSANTVSRALLQLGIKKGDKIAVITSNNRPEWHALDIGILQIGAHNVPLYPTLSSKDYGFILNHSDALYCFVSDADLLEKVKAVQENTQLKGIFTFDEIEKETSWTSFLSLGNSMTSQTKVDVLKHSVSENDLATIIYTSGTTGTPKGVMLSHKNIVQNTLVSANALDLETQDCRAVSYLPINHIFERFASYFYQYRGIEVYFAESIDQLGDNLKEIQPHFMPVVPRLLEKIFDKIVAKGAALSGIKKGLFFWALQLAEGYKHYNKNTPWYAFKLGIARRLIFKKWRAAFGGHVRLMVSGSAPLQERLVTIFTAAGLPICEGYGMTETSPGVTINDLRNKGLKVGTVGKALKDISIKIAEDGEILVKGSNVMMGYYKNEKLTKETIINGYLHTGDIGTLDAEGFLKITDRKKEMFKTSGGKYIAPAVLEQEFKKSRFIEQIMIIGEHQKMPAALIQVPIDVVNEWARRHDYVIDDMTTDVKFLAKMQREIDSHNTHFGQWEQIKKFEITPDIWTIADGHLTPTMKMRRKIITKKYAHLIEKIYNS